MKDRADRENWFLRWGLILTGFVLLLVLISCFWTPYDPNFMDASARLDPPSLSHPFGTDNFGRDILSRVLDGARTTLIVSMCINLIGLVVGTVIGSVSGYFGGAFDTVLMRICDAITAFPNVMLALVIIAVFGSSDTNVIWVLGVLFIPSYARMARSEFVRQKNLNYVSLAKLMGAGPFRIMLIHILPNIKAMLLPAFTIGFNNAVLAEASMSFLGVGVSANRPSLGRMLNEAQSFLISGSPWYAGFVGIMIVLLVLGLSLLGEGLQQRQRGKVR